MDCKEIQGLILTDYIDARMGERQKGLIDQHLSHCLACEGFLINLKKEVIAPFNNAPKAVADQFLWARIKQAIEKGQEQQLEAGLRPGFWERIRSAVHIPRPAFALATIVTMIFMIGTTGQFFINNMFVKINGQDQAEYLSSLINEPTEIAGNNGNDQQTAIEKYFL